MRSEGAPTSDFTSSLDWMAGKHLTQFTLNTPPVVSTKQRVASVNQQSKVDSSVPSIFVCSSLSRCCDLHAHRCSPKRWQTPSCCLWLLSGICSVAVLSTQLHRSSVCVSEEVSLGDGPDTHGPMFSPCSEPHRSLARQLHLAGRLLEPLTANRNVGCQRRDLEELWTAVH